MTTDIFLEGDDVFSITAPKPINLNPVEDELKKIFNKHAVNFNSRPEYFEGFKSNVRKNIREQHQDHSSSPFQCIYNQLPVLKVPLKLEVKELEGQFLVTNVTICSKDL